MLSPRSIKFYARDESLIQTGLNGFSIILTGIGTRAENTRYWRVSGIQESMIGDRCPAEGVRTVQS